MEGLIVDSSVWIEALRKSKSSHDTHSKKVITFLLEKNYFIYSCKVIQVEVSQGAKDITSFKEIWDSFLGFEFLEIDDHIWNVSANNFFKLRKKGITIGTLDCLIATLSAFYDVQLLTKDKSLQKAAQFLGVELFHPPF